jgi:hypothetical protein
VSDRDGWIYFDGSEPEPLRSFLDALRELPPSTQEEKERSVGRLCETLDAELVRRVKALAATIATVARAPGDQQVGQVGEDGATVRSPIFDPAAQPPAEPPSLPVAAWEPRPPEVTPAEELKITAPALELPAELRGPRLPFKPRAPGPELARTMQVPVPNWKKGETEPLGDDSVAKAVAALPFIGNTVGAGVVPFPRLSLEAYASLRAELLVWPERWAEILPRYHVMNAAARRALDEHWTMELAASPEARATFDRALAEYTAWLRSRRG